MDIMKDKVYNEVIALLFKDQGLNIPKTCNISLSKLGITPGEWARARKYLKTLNQKDLERFCIGDHDEDVLPMVKAGKGPAKAAHKVVDELFNWEFVDGEDDEVGSRI